MEKKNFIGFRCRDEAFIADDVQCQEPSCLDYSISLPFQSFLRLAIHFKRGHVSFLSVSDQVSKCTTIILPIHLILRYKIDLQRIFIISFCLLGVDGWVRRKGCCVKKQISSFAFFIISKQIISPWVD